MPARTRTPGVIEGFLARERALGEQAHEPEAGQRTGREGEDLRDAGRPVQVHEHRAGAQIDTVYPYGVALAVTTVPRAARSVRGDDPTPSGGGIAHAGAGVLSPRSPPVAPADFTP